MRTVFDQEEEENIPAADSKSVRALKQDPEPSEDRELTISSTTLLAIFFGLVLLCGLFFGLGYTLGRRSPADPNLTPAAAAPQTSDSASKPSAAAQTVVPVPVTAQPETPDPSTAANPAETEPSEQLAQPKPDTKAPEPATPAASTKAPRPDAKPDAQPTPQPDAATTPIMVQIAAISNPADADVLVNALQKRGYTVAVRRTTTDSLIHVQVGPFSNKADAIAMRQKLLSDGYNAILK